MVRGHAGLDQVRYTLRRMGTPSAESNVTLRASGNADSVTLTVVGSDRRLPGFELSVDVPDWLVQILMETRTGDILASDLELRSGGGEIRLGRVSGSVRCFSSAGGIRAESVGRESWFQTGGGDLVVLESGGKLHLSTGGGNIQVDRSAGEVFASTRGGAIKLGQVNGMVTAETDGGTVQVDSASGLRCLSAAGMVRLRNGTGEVTVFLSSNTVVTVQARIESGGREPGIVSEFPEIRVRDRLFAEGSLNGGGPRLSILAAGGTIYLLRKK